MEATLRALAHPSTTSATWGPGHGFHVALLREPAPEPNSHRTPGPCSSGLMSDTKSHRSPGRQCFAPKAVSTLPSPARRHSRLSRLGALAILPPHPGTE